MTTPNHPLFQTYPLSGTAQISTGEVPLPYQIYDGYGAFIGGTADLAKVRQLLANEEVQPVQNEAGRALMGIWLCDFTQASLGPHHELQLSIFVASGELEPVSAHRLGLLAAMLTRPDMQMLCHGLWNNTPVVVAYNRELLSLDARLSDSTMHCTAQALSSTVKDAERGAPLLESKLSKPTQASVGATFGLLGQMGLGRALRISRQPWVEMKIVNPLGVKLLHNGTAMAYTSNAANRVRYFDPKHDLLRLDAVPYATLDFQPEFVQHMAGFKFVYQEPA
ncbi:MAG: hypothetical protein IT328_12970 [Caldilineaceae bacterium]|nr:hypothetical protein [Caldilineaceae bacterium]